MRSNRFTRRTFLPCAVVLALLAAGPTASAHAADEPDPSAPTVLVEVASAGVADEVAARHGLTVVRAFPWIGWYELATPPGTVDAEAAKRALDADEDVERTDALARGERFVPTYTPKDPIWTPGATLQSGETLAWYLSKVNFPAAWDQTTGTGASIGIIDSEFDTGHPDLQSKVRTPYNTSSGTPQYHTGDVRATGGAASLHGTHVAGIAAGTTDNGIGISGGGFDATFVPVKVNTSFTPGGGNPVDASFVADLTEGLGYIANSGVGVVNMSLGTTRNHAPLNDAIQAVRARGITVIAAAGNFQQEQPNAPIYPASYPGVIAVANTQANDTINASSSNGEWVDIAAPGTNIVSTWDRNDPQGSFSNGQDANYHVISGTSMASPLVAGLVALMKSARPDLSPDEVEMLLKRTARDLGSGGPDPQFGAGLIDANAAVSAARSYARPTPPPPPPPPPPVDPVADTVAPGVKIAKIVTRKGRKITMRFKCTEACRGVLRFRTSTNRTLASKQFSAEPNKSVRVRVKLKKSLYKSYKRKLKRKKSRFVVEVAARDAAGNLATQRARRKLLA